MPTKIPFLTIPKTGQTLPKKRVVTICHRRMSPTSPTYALAEASGAVLQNTTNNIKQAVLAIRDLRTDLHERAHTVHGLKDVVLAQNRDVHVLALQKFVSNKNIDHDIIPGDVCAFARTCFKQKTNLLFLNSNGVLCAKYPHSQGSLDERPCMIVMPQLYQHEILFRAHDAMGHQGISKVIARIQERHTWLGLRRTVGQYVGQCLTCQQVRDKQTTFAFTSKTSKAGTLMSWSSTTT